MKKGGIGTIILLMGVSVTTYVWGLPALGIGFMIYGLILTGADWVTAICKSM